MPEFTLILAGDHVYKMDYGELVRHHLARAADVTVSAVEAPCAAAAGQLGVLDIDGEGRIVGFEEKPARPSRCRGRPTFASPRWASTCSGRIRSSAP